jgi:AcrR family transcriptional regulator
MSPRRRHPHVDDVRTQLLDAALAVFARQGFDGASVRDIAAEAQVAPGLLYYYFPSKQAVLQALFERSAGLVMAAFAHAAAVPDARERLGELVRVSARLVREHESFWRIAYGVRFQHAVVAGLGDGIAAQSALYVQLFSALLNEIGRPQPEMDARQLFATLDGVFQHYVLDPEHYPLDAMVERIIHQFGGVSAVESP